MFDRFMKYPPASIHFSCKMYRKKAVLLFLRICLPGMPTRYARCQLRLLSFFFEGDGRLALY